MAEPRPVVVGLDGSEGAALALRVAAGEAHRVGSRLVVAHGWLITEPGLPLSVPAHLGAATQARLTEELHAEVVRHLPEPGDLPVQERVVYGYAGRVLVEASEQAQLLVVGSRGLGALQRALLGSVSQYALERADCPVMVVHGVPAAGYRRVVIGVDGSPWSLAALRWGVDRAGRDDLPAVAVHAGAPVYSHLYPVPAMLLEGWEGPVVAGERLDGWLVSTLGEARAATVDRVVGNRPAAHLLLDCVTGADLVVLGRRGAGGVAGLHLGSVARRVASQAPGAVVVLGADA
jgi:nucleotide-binding universal stress UspA family protein